MIRLFQLSALIFHLAALVASAEGGLTSTVTGTDLPFTILEPLPTPHSSSEISNPKSEIQNPKSPPSLVFYLQNLASPRLGTVADDLLIQELRASGHLVAIIDYQNHPRARVPFINADLAAIRDNLRAKILLADRKLDNAHIYIVPSGHRLQRDVLYWPDHDRPLSLDLIYPAKPAQPVGTVLEFSCDNKDRFGNSSLSICNDTLLDGAATEGFAIAMADHPVAPPYKGLDPMPDCARMIKAAVRTLRVTAAPLGLGDRIVPVGFSRGSGMALMLLTTENYPDLDPSPQIQNPKSKIENSTPPPSLNFHPSSFNGAAQPHSVQGAVILSGRFTYLDLLPDDPMIPRYEKVWGPRAQNLDTWRLHGALDHLTQPTVPLFLSINITESPHALHQMKILRQRLAELGSDDTFIMEREPRGHKVPRDPALLDALYRYLHQRLQH